MNVIETMKEADRLRALGYKVEERTDRVVVQDPVMVNGVAGAEYTPVTLRSGEQVARFINERN